MYFVFYFDKIFMSNGYLKDPTMNARLPQTPIDAEQAIGQIAVQLPGSTAIFRRLKLDFC